MLFKRKSKQPANYRKVIGRYKEYSLCSSVEFDIMEEDKDRVEQWIDTAKAQGLRAKVVWY